MPRWRRGAIGLSTGTFYPPAASAPAEEIIGVGRDLKRFGGMYATHMRTEGDGVIEAIEESARIARARARAGVSRHDDRVRRDSVRRLPASTPVGHVRRAAR